MARLHSAGVEPVHILTSGRDAEHHALIEKSLFVAGECVVKLDGNSEVRTCAAGQAFEVPARSGFDIEVKSGACDYICTFLG